MLSIWSGSKFCCMGKGEIVSVWSCLRLWVIFLLLPQIYLRKVVSGFEKKICITNSVRKLYKNTYSISPNKRALSDKH